MGHVGLEVLDSISDPSHSRWIPRAEYQVASCKEPIFGVLFDQLVDVVTVAFQDRRFGVYNFVFATTLPVPGVKLQYPHVTR
jgi:hypothetical protein